MQEHSEQIDIIHKTSISSIIIYVLQKSLLNTLIAFK